MDKQEYKDFNKINSIAKSMANSGIYYVQDSTVYSLEDKETLCVSFMDISDYTNISEVLNRGGIRGKDLNKFIKENKDFECTRSDKSIDFVGKETLNMNIVKTNKSPYLDKIRRYYETYIIKSPNKVVMDITELAATINKNKTFETIRDEELSITKIRISKKMLKGYSSGDTVELEVISVEESLGIGLLNVKIDKGDLVVNNLYAIILY